MTTLLSCLILLAETKKNPQIMIIETFSPIL